MTDPKSLYKKIKIIPIMGLILKYIVKIENK